MFEKVNFGLPNLTKPKKKKKKVSLGTQQNITKFSQGQNLSKICFISKILSCGCLTKIYTYIP